MSVEFGGFQKLSKKFNRLEKESGEICETCVKELGGRFLALVIPETPVYIPKAKEHKKTVYKRTESSSLGVVYVRKERVRYRRKITYTNKKGEQTHKWKLRASPLHIGGTLKRGWTAKTHEEAERGNGEPSKKDGKEFIQRNGVTKSGAVYTITLINPVYYAPYVEYGHRLVNGGFWEGKFFLRRSWDKLRPKIPAILNKKLNEEIKKRFDNG